MSEITATPDIFQTDTVADKIDKLILRTNEQEDRIGILIQQNEALQELVDKLTTRVDKKIEKPIAVTRIDADFHFQMSLELAAKSVMQMYGPLAARKDQIPHVTAHIIEMAEALHNGIAEHFIAEDSGDSDED